MYEQALELQNVKAPLYNRSKGSVVSPVIRQSASARCGVFPYLMFVSIQYDRARTNYVDNDFYLRDKFSEEVRIIVRTAEEFV